MKIEKTEIARIHRRCGGELGRDGHGEYCLKCGRYVQGFHEEELPPKVDSAEAQLFQPFTCDCGKQVGLMDNVCVVEIKMKCKECAEAQDQEGD